MNNLEAYKGVFVFAQQVDNVISNIAYELIGKGKELAKDLGVEVTAVLVGSDVKGLADQLAEYGSVRYSFNSGSSTTITLSAPYSAN